MNSDPSQVSRFFLLSDGGPFVWALALVGVFGVAIMIERIYYLHSKQIRAQDFLEGIRNNLRSGHYNEALTVCEEAPGPVARIVKAILVRRERGEAGMRIAAEEAAVAELPALERRAGTVCALARIAPLIGLAGTVFGLLRAFLNMRSAGHYASADLFAGDIASALAATGFGLVLAIVFQLGHHLIAGRIRAVTTDFEKTGISLISFIVHELNEPDAAAGADDPAAK